MQDVQEAGSSTTRKQECGKTVYIFLGSSHTDTSVCTYTAERTASYTGMSMQILLCQVSKQKTSWVQLYLHTQRKESE